MNLTATLTRIVLAVVIVLSLATAAAARNPAREVAEAGVDEAVVHSDPLRQSPLWNVFPEAPGFDATARYPYQDMGIFPFDNLMRTPVEAVKQPEQCDEVCPRLPVEAVKQPEQCDEMCPRLPVEAVKQPEQCDEICPRLPVEAVKQPEQCDEMCPRLPVEAVKQPEQCDEMCPRLPTQAVREPLCVECFGPTMRLNLKNAAATEVAIYSVNGRLVRRMSEQLPSGESDLTWDGRTDFGTRAASGVYFAQVQAGVDVGKGKLVLVR